MSKASLSRIFRAVLLGGLLLTQIQLLWIAAFHWNEEQYPSVSRTETVRDSRGLPAPLSHGKTPCVVCQIVRQNAMRPGVGAPTPQLFSAVAHQAPLTSSIFHSHDRNVANGRAPPLS